jgi:pimeloyl-ACP methyl ester carboxylesterase
MIVLTQGRALPDPSSIEAGVRRGWVGLQQRFAERSKRGRLVLVPNSGHGIPMEAPDAVISAVRDIMREVRGGTGR